METSLPGMDKDTNPVAIENKKAARLSEPFASISSCLIRTSAANSPKLPFDSALRQLS
jgi:hypothetical protein